MEKYTINISNTWSIESLKNANKNIEFDKVDYNLPFGQSEFINGEINWLLDSLPLFEESIEYCKNIEAFDKKVNFTVMQLNKDWEKIDEFEGTFIDALNYIKEEFNE